MLRRTLALFCLLAPAVGAFSWTPPARTTRDSANGQWQATVTPGS